MKEFIFRFRGWLFVPSALLMLYLAKPTPLSLAIGFLIALMGESIRIWAVGFSGVTTRKSELEAPLLVTAGPYAMVRNPLYVGNLITWFGFSIAAAGAAPLWAQIVIIGSMILSYAIIYGNIIPLEEQFLEKQFGEPFREYLKHVPPMLPQLKPYDKQNGTWDPGVILKAESQTIIMLLIAGAILVLKFVKVIP